MKILITGGAGFIGSNLAQYFLETGNQVTIFDNLSRPGVQSNLDWLLTLPSKPVFIKGDVCDDRALGDAVKGKEVIFHEAGQTAVTTSLKDPIHDFNVNARGTFNVVESMRQHNKKALLIYASTNKVYGSLAHWQFSEGKTRYVPKKDKAVSEKEPLDFHSPYGCSKGAGDQYVRDYARSYGLKTVVFRQSCIYGEHQLGVEDQGWLAHFAAQCIKKQPITIFGNGKQVRDALYIGDLVQAYALAIKHISVTAGQVYNIGGGIANTISLLELIHMLDEMINTNRVSYQDSRVGDQVYYVSDIKKAKTDFGWEPKTDTHEGISRLVAWLHTAL